MRKQPEDNGKVWSVLQLVVSILLFLVGGVRSCQDRVTTEASKDWWQTAQFYQIYPRSFMDSDGDGIGDLKGITSKLEYLKDIGETAVWLSPIFTSPMVDFGYDISDFYGIQPEYGTMDDFRALITRAKELGLKILLDFVPNHSSTECEWFKKSVRRERGYENFYVWADGKINSTGHRVPPSNWLSFFRGSAWAWNDERQQYYFHQFAVQQADLNYRDPLVVEQMKRVLRYWLDQGVDGYRIDAVPALFEVGPDANGVYPDAEKSGLTEDQDDRDYLKLQNMLEDQPETIDMIYQWRQVMDDYKRVHGGDTRVLLIETYAPLDYTNQMYGNATMEGAQLPFNFNLITQLLGTTVTATKVKKAVADWLTNMPAGRTANWVIGNHDNRRAASRYGIENADAMNMLVLMLPGASVTYQGEELAMTDADISWENTVDPSACNSNKDIFQELTRDPERSPFQWTPGTNAGFSTAAKTWLPLAADYQTTNVETESAATRSHLKIYKSLVELRKTSRTLQYGAWKYEALNDSVFVLKRFLAGESPIVFVANFGGGPFTLDLGSQFDRNLPDALKVKVRSLTSSKAINDSLTTKTLNLVANEALVLSTS